MRELASRTASRRADLRPGAMTMAMEAARGRASESGDPRVLRIGVLRHGRIEQERVLRSRDTVTVGADERATFVLPFAGLGARHPLFERVGEGYVLNLLDSMRGRVALPEGLVPFDVLRAAGRLRLPLDDRARGKVDLDGVTLLFQMVPPPPVTPRPRLPAAVSGGLIGGIDWFFTTVATATFMAFCAFGLFLESADWPVAVGPGPLPELVELLMEETPPPDAPVDLEMPAEDVSPEEGEDASMTDATGPEAPAPARRRRSLPAPPSLADVEQARSAYLMQIGALSARREGSAFDALRDGAPTTDAAALLARVDGSRLATGQAGVLHERRSGCGEGDTGLCGPSEGLGRLVAVATEQAHRQAREGGAVREVLVRRPAVLIDVDEGFDDGSGVFDARIVSREVRRRVGSIRTCYEHEISRHPDLAGKVTMRFTIQEAGNVSNVRTLENRTGSLGLAECVARNLRSMRFHPGPEGGEVSFTFPFVFAAQR